MKDSLELSVNLNEPAEQLYNDWLDSIIHSNMPEGQGENYKQGWKDFYFKPMKKFYNKK
jgi:hypothetical protein